MLSHTRKLKLIGGLSLLALALSTGGAWGQVESNDSGSAAGGIVAALFGVGMLVVWAVVALAVLAGMWKIFEKAGKPGWAAIIPIYNLIVLLEIVGRPVWWVAVILLVPCVNIIFLVMMYNDLARKFGQGAGFTIGMLLLPIIFFPLLGFGNSQYDPAL